MSYHGSEDMEDLGNEALVFAYGHNVNLYEDVFGIAETASTKEIHLTFTGLLRELEVSQNALLDYNDRDEVQKQYARRLGMKQSHFAVGMHPRDFLDIKMDAVKRAYGILTDAKSRREYDDCLREYQESFENAQEADDANDVVSDVSSEDDREAEDENDSNDGNDSLYDAPSVQAQADTDFPLLSTFHHSEDVFDPFNLQDDLPGQQDFTFSENAFVPMQDSLTVPISPDGSFALSASFIGMHPHGHETSVRICALPSPDSDDDSSVNSEYSELLDTFQKFETTSKGTVRSRKISLEPEADILLASNLSSEEEDELVSFQALSKSMSDLDEKQREFFSQMDAGLDNVECFSDDDSDIVEQEADNMSIASLTQEKEVGDHKKGQHVWICLDAFMDEVTGTLDDTALTFEQMCGMV
jgi:curved DNA-binding protein CbpA